MVQMNAVYTGNKHCEIVHEPSHSKIVTDAPKDNHGLGEAFSPTDLMTSSLGVCILTTMAIQGEPKGWNLKGATAKIVKEMASNPRRVGKITTLLTLPASLSLEARLFLENVALNCPVKLSLHPEILFEINFQYL